MNILQEYIQELLETLSDYKIIPNDFALTKREKEIIYKMKSNLDSLQSKAEYFYNKGDYETAENYDAEYEELAEKLESYLEQTLEDIDNSHDLEPSIDDPYLTHSPDIGNLFAIEYHKFINGWLHGIDTEKELADSLRHYLQDVNPTFLGASDDEIIEAAKDAYAAEIDRRNRIKSKKDKHIKELTLESEQLSLPFDEDSQALLHEDFLNWLNDGDFLDEETAIKLLNIFAKNVQKIKTNTGKEFIVFDYDNERYVSDDIEWGAQTAKDWLDRIESMGDPEEYVNITNDGDDFWEYPQTLYHGTDSSNVESILKHGLEVRNKTRGISNRGTGAAVFTTTNPEYASENYGDVVFAINTKKMKANNYMPPVSVEEPIKEYEAMRALASYFEIEYEGDIEHGIDYDTFIIYGNVPPEYLEII